MSLGDIGQNTTDLFHKQSSYGVNDEDDGLLRGDMLVSNLARARALGPCLTSPILKPSSSGTVLSWEYFKSYRRSLAKSRTDSLFRPLPDRKLALYLKVKIRASLMSSSRGRNFRG